MRPQILRRSQITYVIYVAAVAIPPRRGGAHEGGREGLVGMAAAGLWSCAEVSKKRPEPASLEFSNTL